MKTLTSFAILLLALATAACSKYDKESKTVAEQITNAVASGDAAALAAVDSTFQADMATDPEHALDRRKCLAEYADEKIDTANMAIRVVAELPKQLGQTLADLLIEADDEPLDVFVTTLGTVRYLYDAVGRIDDFAIFNAAYQARIDSLPLDRQMKIYVAVSTPVSLGEVMADDVMNRQGSDAVAADVNERLAVLRTLYDDAQYEQLTGAFSRRLLAADPSGNYITKIKF
ncbi:MAG: hypothetical protein ACI309_06575 [Candidatus Limisoma sp.]